jgi:hypothetical protein
MQVKKWRWRIQASEGWISTAVAYTEAEIRREHPEAIRINRAQVLDGATTEGRGPDVPKGDVDTGME